MITPRLYTASWNNAESYLSIPSYIPTWHYATHPAGKSSTANWLQWKVATSGSLLEFCFDTSNLVWWKRADVSKEQIACVCSHASGEEFLWGWVITGTCPTAPNSITESGGGGHEQNKSTNAVNCIQLRTLPSEHERNGPEGVRARGMWPTEGPEMEAQELIRVVWSLQRIYLTTHSVAQNTRVPVGEWITSGWKLTFSASSPTFTHTNAGPYLYCCLVKESKRQSYVTIQPTVSQTVFV
jgi:hypothetical protein